MHGLSLFMKLNFASDSTLLSHSFFVNHLPLLVNQTSPNKFRNKICGTSTVVAFMRFSQSRSLRAIPTIFPTNSVLNFLFLIIPSRAYYVNRLSSIYWKILSHLCSLLSSYYKFTFYKILQYTSPYFIWPCPTFPAICQRFLFKILKIRKHGSY